MSKKRRNISATANLTPSASEHQWLRKYVLVLLNELHKDFAVLGVLSEAGPLLQVLADLVVKARS